MKIFSNSVEINTNTENEILVLVSLKKDDFINPDLNVKFEGKSDLHYGSGDKIGKSTYVVFSGQTDKTQIISLRAKTEYKFKILEWGGSTYNQIKEDEFITSSDVNTERFTFTILDNRTRLPLENTSVKLIDHRHDFISEFGKTDRNGKFRTINMPEGSYNIIVEKDGYEILIKKNLFISRKQPLIDNRYRFFDVRRASTVVGGNRERREISHREDITFNLNKINTKNNNFNKYIQSANPSRNNKL